MWPFNRKRPDRKTPGSGPQCSHCQSTHTRLVHQPDYVRTWRGQRYVTCRCLDCGQDFYAEEPREGLASESMTDTGIIEDEEALQKAEDELRKQIEDEDDRRCR